MNDQLPLSVAWVTDAMCKLEDEIRYASQADARVMMTGESGVGKRFAADMIHQLSHRRRAPLVVVNGADLVASRTGTDTMSQFHQGLLQTARNGTLLIQEVENIPASAHSELLRFIENTTTEANNVRLMTATSVPLLQRVETGEFSDDLFYRLNTIHLVIPPLRERPEDIPMMFHYYLSLHARTEVPQLSSAARRRLMEYHWPGNVRELKTVTKRLSAQNLPKILEPEHLQAQLGSC
jgi:DNA-binding NtrC family response regulator